MFNEFIKIKNTPAQFSLSTFKKRILKPSGFKYTNMIKRNLSGNQ